jgi:hypothetical protein
MEVDEGSSLELPKNILRIAGGYPEHPRRPALPAAQNWHIDEKLAIFPKAF